jgi:hypothetical protein
MPLVDPGRSTFIDWLSVSQEHAEAPEWGSVRRIDFDPSTDEILVSQMLGQQVRGSWDSSLRVRCTSGRVEVSGNPSRFGRLDNLFGLTTLPECLVVYNGVLQQLGLPQFELLSCKVVGGFGEVDNGAVVGVSKGAGSLRDFQSWGEAQNPEEVRTIRSGPQISQVHLTRNLLVGRGGERLLLDWFSAQTWGRLPFSRTHDTTVTAGRRDRRMLELYVKGPEIAEHALKWRRARSAEKSVVKEEATEYLERLREWCSSRGVVRQELKLGRKFLNSSDLRHPEKWQDGTADQVYSEQSEVQTMAAGGLADYHNGVFDRLVESGVTEAQAGRMAAVVSAWLAGQPWDRGLSQATRYRWMALLRKSCGLDLRRPVNVRAMAVSIKPRILEVSVMRPCDLPDWYRWAQNSDKEAKAA